VAAVAIAGLASAAYFSVPRTLFDDTGKPKVANFDLEVPVVRTTLERFANDSKTTPEDVRTLAEQDLNAGIWVIHIRSFRSDDLVECADYFLNLANVGDAQAVRIAEVYYLWEGMRPGAFDMTAHDPLRNKILARMLIQAEGREAKKKIQVFIDHLAGERENFRHPEWQIPLMAPDYPVQNTGRRARLAAPRRAGPTTKPAEGESAPSGDGEPRRS
jgi:hypothetical protein